MSPEATQPGMNTAPTLLIGLGGIGSKIVDTVYGWTPIESRDRVVVHAFDTNINDISKLKSMKGNVTQTSTEWTVGQYLYMAGDTVKDWFPYPVPTDLLSKPMTDGAGQIRLVSRLAYRAAIGAGKLDDLQQKIAVMFKEKGEDHINSVRVVIVSSLSGGTGSGIFLQTALYIKELLNNVFHKQNVLIRGAFLLPDILTKTDVLDSSENDNVRANAYASLKELDAITQIASNSGGNSKVTIELEYRPDQVDIARRKAHVITQEHLPYKFVFLYDYENTSGGNIGAFQNYLQQMAKSLYLQLFTPMANDLFSIEDNKILNLIATKGMSRYGGSGVATLSYPYEDIVEYCALRWATDGLTNNWLSPDEAFHAELLQYERDLNAGLSHEQPKLAERYIWLIDNYASDEKPKPFFKQIFRSTRMIGEKGQVGDPKAKLFIAALETEIEKVFNDDNTLKQAEAECQVDDVKLKIKEKALSEVIRIEDALTDLTQKVHTAIAQFRNFIVNQSIGQDCDAPGKMSGQDYRLNTWLLAKQDPMHPVAVRYFLYQVYNELNSRIQLLTPQNKDLGDSIKKYQQSYDLVETEDFVETASDRAKLAQKQKWYAGIFKNQFKEFTEEYSEKASRQFSSLLKFKKDRLTETVFLDIQQHILAMIEDWQRYFSNLRDTRNSLLNEINIQAEKHDRSADPTRLYVLASRSHKEQLWESIRLSLGTNELPPEIARQIYTGQYQRFCAKLKGERVSLQVTEKTEEMFRKDVLAWCRKELLKKDGLSLNIVMAIRKEAELNNIENADDFIRARIRPLTNLARPFIPGSIEASEISFWGVHSIINGLGATMTQELFGSDLIVDNAFSQYEIIRYRAQYGMLATQFLKFSSGNENQQAGDYFKAYRKRIFELTMSGNTITPHLDKRWHTPAYMPDLNPSQAIEDQDRIDRAFYLGMIYGFLIPVLEEGRYIWEFFGGEEGNELVYVNGKPVLGYAHAMHEALYHNPAIVDKVLDRAGKQMEKDRRVNPQVADILKHTFYTGCRTVKVGSPQKESNIMDILFRFPDGDPGDESLPKKSDALIGRLMSEIETYYRLFHGSHRDKTAREEAAKFIEALVNESEAYKTADKEGSRYNSWTSLLKTKIEKLTAKE